VVLGEVVATQVAGVHKSRAMHKSPTVDDRYRKSFGFFVATNLKPSALSLFFSFFCDVLLFSSRVIFWWYLRVFRLNLSGLIPYQSVAVKYRQDQS
jgi:hypothetical protein